MLSVVCFVWLLPVYGRMADETEEVGRTDRYCSFPILLLSVVFVTMIPSYHHIEYTVVNTTTTITTVEGTEW